MATAPDPDPAQAWPLFDLVIRTPLLELRYVSDELGACLTEVAREGIHDPSWSPFSTPWTDHRPPELERNMFRYWWRCRAETSTDRWDLNFAVLVDGAVVGACGAGAQQYPALRQFESGSWLGRRHQGQGWGREIREAVLHLGFAGLDADEATTNAYVDNAPSLAISRRLGYRELGPRRVERRGEPAELVEFRMARQHWSTIRREDIELHGIEPVRELLGISEPSAE